MTALARRPKVKYRTRTVTKYRKARKAKRAPARRQGYFTGPVKKAVAAGAAGFILGQPALQAQVAKLPQLGNRTLTAGLAAYLLNKMVVKNQFIGNIAEAAIIAGAFDFGAKGFGLETFADSAQRDGIVAGYYDGEDDYLDVSGEIGEDEVDSFDETEFDDEEE